MQGLFWEPKSKRVKRKFGAVRVMPRIRSKWKPINPSDWPRLKDAKKIAIDTETYDPNLLTHGPGYARHSGHIVGFSVSVGGNSHWYFPMRHTIESNLNYSPEKALAWAKDNLEYYTNNKRTVIGANLQYDLGWFREEGVNVGGKYLDVLLVEALINEHRLRYTLDSIAERYLGSGKVSNKLYQWLSDYYGGAVNDKQRKNIYRAPVSYVGPYAEGDAAQPFQIWKKQKRIIREQHLETVLDLECRLIPVLLDMRFQGVRVDLKQAELVREQLIEREEVAQKQLNNIAGMDVAVNASKSIEKAFKKHNMKYQLTDKGNPSFTKLFLSNHPSEIAKLIVEIRRVSKLRKTFIEGAILDKNVDGRVYCQFIQLKSEFGGSGPGRFSSKNPNLQNIPSRDKVFAPLIRGCFIPERGYTHWFKSDASQVEYRFLAHFAVGKGAKEIRERYRNDPTTDYHDSTKDLIHKQTGILLERKPTKGINFGIVFGMGVAKLIATLGLDKKAGMELMKAYHSGVPFVKETFDYFSNMAKERGYITTILGRRSRFLHWEEARGDGTTYPSYGEAIKMLGGNVQRAGTHKALNNVVQGSGTGDFIKAVLVKTYEAGIYDALGTLPSVTVHDEVNFSCNFKSKKQRKILKEFKYIAEHAIKAKVPLLMGTELGDNWGSVKEIVLKGKK